MNTRQITVFSTLGQQKTVIETDVTTWSELQDLIIEQIPEINFNKMVAIDRDTKISYEHPDAALPEKDCLIFLRVKDTDKGIDYFSLTMRELREEVKKFKAAYGEDFTAALKKDGNWTQYTTAQLAAVLNNYASLIAKEQEELEISQSSSSAVLVEKEDINLITRILNTLSQKVNQLLDIKEKKDRTELEQLEIESRQIFNKTSYKVK
jgi:hypothetical protein